MNNFPCIRQVVLWLAQQRNRIDRDTLGHKFALNEPDLNALLHYLEHREIIVDVACIGESGIVTSFVSDPSTRRMAADLTYCPGYGDNVQLPLRDRVFIVHGRNTEALGAIRDFLKSLHLQSVTFRDAVRLTDKPTPHVDEIVAAGMAYAYATLVLFTGDEEARLKPCFRASGDHSSEMKLQSQPRPNVIFEAGMALARDPARTILVQYGPHLRPFSDIAGLFVLPIRDTLGDRKALKDRLEKIGCKVSAKSNKWQKAGRFPSAHREFQGESG